MRVNSLIMLTGKNGGRCVINADHILFMDHSDDEGCTVIVIGTAQEGWTATVKESVDEIWNKLSGGSQ